jgi:hypothetical protein
MKIKGVSVQQLELLPFYDKVTFAQLLVNGALYH